MTARADSVVIKEEVHTGVGIHMTAGAVYNQGGSDRGGDSHCIHKIVPLQFTCTHFIGQGKAQWAEIQ